MSPVTAVQVVPEVQVLERLSAGQVVQDVWITGMLDLDPLVVSRWLCGEDMRGIYQPVVVHRCILDGLNLSGRTFYNMVELIDCRIMTAHLKQAYFYSSLLVEDCVFQEDFDGRSIQSEGLVVLHNTVFAGYADFGGISVRNRIDLLDVSFPGGTNLLCSLMDDSQERLGDGVMLRGCRFRAADIPVELEAQWSGITPLVECNLQDVRN
jgi:hypothetical protein